MTAEQMKARTKQFALRCIKLCDSLPKTRSGHMVANQLLRCSSSVAANYRAACRARSTAEFRSKLGVVEEEVDESEFWLEMIIDSGMKPKRLIQPLHCEADELTRIIVASIKTSRAGTIPNPQSAIRNPQ